MNFQIKSKPGAGSCPLQMVAYWKCADGHTDLRLDYKYNSHAMASPSLPLLNLSIAVPVDGGVTKMQSKPDGQWIPESNRALWRFGELFAAPGSDGPEAGGVGSLRGRFELISGPGSQVGLSLLSSFQHCIMFFPTPPGDHRRAVQLRRHHAVRGGLRAGRSGIQAVPSQEEIRLR